MIATKSIDAARQEYEDSAREYLKSLPLEHFMESPSQSKQREITFESLALVHARRPEVQVFGEWLVQYPKPGSKRKGQVVPDNMIVIYDGPLDLDLSFNLDLQPVPPLVVIEYVSPNNPRKDYDDNKKQYEQQLKVPYYLLFYPTDQDLKLFKHNGKKYVTTRPNKRGRLEIAELDLEVAILDRWVRYWYQGELLPLPDELLAKLDKSQEQLEAAESKLEAAESKLEAAESKLEQISSKLEEERRQRLAIEAELARLKATQ